jgi:hypothetical protein
LNSLLKTAICGLSKKSIHYSPFTIHFVPRVLCNLCLNTPRGLDFFASLHLTIFEQPANFEFFNRQLHISPRPSRPGVGLGFKSVGCLTEPGIVCRIVDARAARNFRPTSDDSTLRGRRRSSGGLEGQADTRPPFWDGLSDDVSCQRLRVFGIYRALRFFSKNSIDSQERSCTPSKIMK